ncbi:MAG: class I SAM-dependent methyltransferase [Planctomycetota bacterium]
MTTPRNLTYPEPGIPGWMHLDSMHFLSGAVREARAERCIEIGSFFGRSAYAICTALAERSASTSLVCVDRWSQALTEAYLASPHMAEMFSWFDPSVRRSYAEACEGGSARDAFEHTMGSFAFMRDRIEMLQCDSEVLSQELPADRRFDFAFVDGDHTEAGVRRDVLTVLGHLDPNATVVLDDCFDRFPGVVRFVDELVDHAGVESVDRHRGLVRLVVQDPASLRAALRTTGSA